MKTYTQIAQWTENVKETLF